MCSFIASETERGELVQQALQDGRSRPASMQRWGNDPFVIAARQQYRSWKATPRPASAALDFAEHIGKPAGHHAVCAGHVAS
jgi:hypothetical protein